MQQHSFSLCISTPPKISKVPKRTQSALKTPLALHPHTHTTHGAHYHRISYEGRLKFPRPWLSSRVGYSKTQMIASKMSRKGQKNPWNDWTNGKSKTIKNRFSVVKQNWGIFGSWAHHEKGLKRLSKALAPQASKRSHNCAVPIVFSSGSRGSLLRCSIHILYARWVQWILHSLQGSCLLFKHF